MKKSDILRAIQKVEQLAKGSKWQRFLAAPSPYLKAFWFNKVLYPRRKKALQQRTTTCYGLPFTVALPAGTDIYLTGGKTHISEIRLAIFLTRYFPDGGIYLDIGAHYGYFAGLVAALHSQNKVSCFEPAPDTYLLLAENVASMQTETYQKGMADAVGQLTFYQFPARFSEYNSLDIEQYQNEDWIKEYPPKAINVDITTLDQASTNSPHLIKIDVEGAEDKVILGGAQLLAQPNVMVIMEYLPSHKSNGSHSRALALMQQWDYQVFRLMDDGTPYPCPEPEEWLTSTEQDSANLLFTKQLPTLCL
ncbi:MAG: FkbM family methyltransferase [Bacteroidota bacterium]